MSRVGAVKRPACRVGYRWRGALGRFTLSFGEVAPDGKVAGGLQGRFSHRATA
jgi:hypothetical protein